MYKISKNIIKLRKVIYILFLLILVTQITQTRTVLADDDYILATASTGGTYYPVGVAIATLSKVKLKPKHKFSLSAINSAGSEENISLINSGEAAFAIVQGLYASDATLGTGRYLKAGKQTNLRGVSMLWQNVEHFVLSTNLVKKGTVSDLKSVGRKLKAGLGAETSGTFGSNQALLNGLGFKDLKNDFSLFFAGYTPTAEEMQNRKLDFISIPAGIPVSSLTKLFASSSNLAVILGVTDAELKLVDNGRNLWTRFIIPKNTYPNQSKAVATIAQPNLLLVSKDVSDEHVYLLTKAIYDNLPFLTAIHPATKVISLENSIKGLPLPLHNGAIRFYKEAGLTIPDRLIAK